MTTIQNAALALVRAGLTDLACELPDGLDWNQIHQIAADQGLVCVIYHGIQISKPDIPSDFMRYFQVEALSMRRSEYLQSTEINSLFSDFEAGRIDYLPLKGLDYKALYPRPEYRWMSDADIFIRRSQYKEISKILEQRGYTFLCETDHELVWDKKGVLHLEIHKNIADPTYGKYTARFNDAFSFAEKIGDTHRYRFNATDQLVYATNHFAKHHILEGGKLRNLIDLYYLSKDERVDQKELHTVFSELSLEKLYETALNTVNCLMKGEPIDKKGQIMLDRIMADSDEFVETREFALRAARQNEGEKQLSRTTKARTLLYSVFLPYRIMQRDYPVLRKVPVLLPAFWVYRIFNALLFRRDRMYRLMKVAYKETPDRVREYMEEIDSLGLTDWVEQEKLK